MDRSRILVTLIAVISLSLGAIWPNGAMAAMAPAVQSLGALQEGLKVPGKLDIDAMGNIYVADARVGSVYKYDAAGVLRKTFDAVSASGLGLAVTADGKRLYVGVEGHVEILDGVTGARVGQLEAGGALADVAIDAAGNVYAVDVAATKVNVYDAAGVYQRSISGLGTGDGLFRRITALAINKVTGEVYVAGEGVLPSRTSGCSIVQVFGLDGQFRGKLVDAADFGGSVVTLCKGIAFDAAGREYYLDAIKSNIRVRDRAAGYLATLAIGGTDAGQVVQPAGVVFDGKTSRLLVASDYSKVEVFGVDGGQTPPRNQAPALPQMLSPVAGGEVDTLLPQLLFANVVDAEGDTLVYDVQLEGAPQQQVAEMAGGETYLAVTEPLVENGAYRWSVQANDGLDVSGFTAAQTFYVNAVQEAPSAPSLLAGAAGEILSGGDVLSWSASTDADPGDTVSYRVEVAAAADFAAPVLAGQFSATQVALGSFEKYLDLVDGENYLWRVTAVDNHGDSAVSAVGQFVYDTSVLTVTANMPDARVFLTGNASYPGNYVGTVPVEFRDLAAGQYTLVVERSGFESYVSQVVVAETGNVRVAADLQLAVAPDLRKGADLRADSGRLQVNGAAAPFAVDYDADGLVDLLVGDSMTGQVVLYRALEQRGAKVKYAAAEPLVPGVAPVVVDWDGDNISELLVGQLDGSVVLYPRPTATAFVRGAALTCENGQVNVGVNASPAVIDIDDDGDKDLVVGNAAGDLLLFENTAGAGAVPALAAGVKIGSFNAQVSPLAADWNADGVRELLVGCGGALNLLQKSDDGLYVAVTTLADAGVSGDVRFCVVDIDGGSGKDVFVGTSTGQVQLCRSSGKEYQPTVTGALLVKVAQLAGLGANDASLAPVAAAIEAGDFAVAGRLVRSIDMNGASADLATAADELVALLSR